MMCYHCCCCCCPSLLIAAFAVAGFVTSSVVATPADVIKGSVAAAVPDVVAADLTDLPHLA